MKWDKLCLKNAKSFNSLFYCYEQNGIEYAHLGIDDEMRLKSNELANFCHHSIFTQMGPYTGEKLREDIERRIDEAVDEDVMGPNKIVCYFAHDSTLGSFYYAFELDKKFQTQMSAAKFCSYFAIECTVKEVNDPNNGN